MANSKYMPHGQLGLHGNIMAIFALNPFILPQLTANTTTITIETSRHQKLPTSKEKVGPNQRWWKQPRSKKNTQTASVFGPVNPPTSRACCASVGLRRNRSPDPSKGDQASHWQLGPGSPVGGDLDGSSKYWVLMVRSNRNFGEKTSWYGKLYPHISTGIHTCQGCRIYSFNSTISNAVST